MIEKCRFGRMVIGGRRYNTDLWIDPGRRVRDGWRRSEGHRLTLSDISGLIMTQPEILVVGTGIFGRMRLDADIEAHLLDQNIKLDAAHTKTAAEIYNQFLSQGRCVAACFHLTC